MSDKYSKFSEALVYVAGGAFLAWYVYVSIRDALKPPEEIRSPDPDDPVACAFWYQYGKP